MNGCRYGRSCHRFQRGMILSASFLVANYPYSRCAVDKLGRFPGSWFALLKPELVNVSKSGKVQ